MKMTGQSISDVKSATMVNTPAIAKLEMQMGQLANHLGKRDNGMFPSHLKPNPKAFACAGDCHTEVRETGGQSYGGPRS